jgi:spore coat protein U-like protein
MRLTPLVLSAILAAGGLTTHVDAATTPTKLSTCTVALSPISFGPVAHAGSSIPVTLSVNCSAGAAFTVKLLQDGGCRDVRSMSSDGNVLVYRIVVPHSGQTWCDGTGATAAFAGVGTGAFQTFFTTAVVLDDVGRKHAGSYADHINGTVEIALP